jgi:hypothetical protein
VEGRGESCTGSPEIGVGIHPHATSSATGNTTAAAATTQPVERFTGATSRAGHSGDVADP